MTGDSWTHRIARVMVKPLVGTAVTPNHLTTLRLVTGLGACAAFGVGTKHWDNWGGILWVLSAFLDRADGELARLAKAQTRWGHLYDYACDVAIAALFFVAIGFGAREGSFGLWAIGLGILAGISVAAAALMSEEIERKTDTGAKAYEGAAGFDFDDIMYIFGPLAWFHVLGPLVIGAAVCAPPFAVWTWMRLRRAQRALAQAKAPA
jgi:phosphatidylglycerophosphate synthase